jgi:hypothetical protein
MRGYARSSSRHAQRIAAREQEIEDAEHDHAANAEPVQHQPEQQAEYSTAAAHAAAAETLPPLVADIVAGPVVVEPHAVHSLTPLEQCFAASGVAKEGAGDERVRNARPSLILSRD